MNKKINPTGKGGKEGRTVKYELKCWTVLVTDHSCPAKPV